MRNILIISNRLGIGGAEKLLFELAVFSKNNNVNPTVLILDNYGREYYEDVLRNRGIKVVRTRINQVKHIRAPFKMIRSAWWAIKLKFFAAKCYESVHTIGLYNADKVFNTVIHPCRFFWNVNNAVQYPNRKYSYQQEIFSNSNDTVININKYQETELYQQYGNAISTKMVLAKLFINDTD